MQYKLGNKIILSYILLSLIVVGLISFFTNLIIQKEFQDYVIQNQDKLTTDIMNEIVDHYSTNSGYDPTIIESIGVRAIEQGLIIRIIDVNDNIVWSAMEHNSGLCEAMISNVRENMYNYYASWSGDYEEKSFEIYDDQNYIGSLTTGYVGPYYFKEEEIHFLNSLNKILAYIAIGSFFIALFIGIVMAKSITLPITRVITLINSIHIDSSRTDNVFKNNTIELQSLYDSTLSLEKRIQKQELLRKQLTQDIAHELRTPLTAVQGHMEAMIDGIWEITIERLTSCYDEVIHIKGLIQQIEDLSRLENNNLILQKESINIESFLDEITLALSSELHNQNMNVNYDVGNISLFADREKMKQVFYNLFSNSIEYAGVNSSINIYSYASESTITFLFGDNGNGVPEKDKPFIFERFYRADPSRSKNKGIGIGLTISKAIIEAHDGTLSLNKDNIEKGIEFIIRLPIH